LQHSSESVHGFQLQILSSAFKMTSMYIILSQWKRKTEPT